jgi:hypothetical protein
MEQIIWQILFFGSIIAILIICGLAIWYIRRNPLQPFARNLLLILIGFELFQAFMHLLTLGDTLPLFWQWFFDMQYELNLTASFSAIQLFIIASVMFIIATFTPGFKLWQRAYWLMMAVLFVYLSFDEFYEFHETFGSRVPTEAWRVPYAIGGSIIAGISGLAWWFGFRRELPVFFLMFAGLAVMAISGIGIEEFVLQGFVSYDPSAEWMYLFEEFFEMVGATIILATLLSYVQRQLTLVGWQQAKRFVMIAAVAGTVWYALALFVIPGLEARFVARQVNVEYEDGLLTLVGYYLYPEEIRPGDELVINLYWQASEPLPEDYSLSMHLLKHNTSDSYAQIDELHMGPIPSSAFFPGVVTRRTVFMDVPRSLPTPGRYDLMMRVWYGPWPYYTPTDETVGLVITRSDERPLLVDDTVLFARVVAAPADDVPAPESAADYEFPAAGFALMGYDLPQEPLISSSLPVRFWWQTRTRTSQNLTQFFHLFNDETEALFTFDQPPFGGSFPTSDWPAGMTAVDEWNLSLPEDMPPGEYTIYTGLYDAETLARSPITQGGSPVEHDRITLGTIRYQPDEAAAAAAARQEMIATCYVVANDHLGLRDARDRLVAVNRFTGAVTDIGITGTEEVEGLTMALDGSVLYTVEDAHVGLFGTIDMQTGVFTQIGEGVATIENPASHPVLGTDTLKDPDALDIDRQTGILWAIHFHRGPENPRDLLYQIDMENGTVVRDAFGPGLDYVMIDKSSLPGPDTYRKIEALAIHPTEGTFYVMAQADETYRSYLARIDFDTLDSEQGTVSIVPVAQITDQNGDMLRDVEGLSFVGDGRLYATTSDNSNHDDYHDSLWELDPDTGSARQIVSFRNHFEYMDYESVACYTGLDAE